MKYMFRGFIMANWYEANFFQIKYIDLNRVVIKYYINYYVLYQYDRNKIANNSQIQRERLLTWYKNIQNDTIEGRYL